MRNRRWMRHRRWSKRRWTSLLMLTFRNKAKTSWSLTLFSFTPRTFRSKTERLSRRKTNEIWSITFKRWVSFKQTNRKQAQFRTASMNSLSSNRLTEARCRITKVRLIEWVKRRMESELINSNSKTSRLSIRSSLCLRKAPSRETSFCRES